MSNPTSRRFFLGAVTAAAATRVWGANDKINVAIIGLGGRGSSHVNTYPRLPDARVAGLCDIDQAAREKAQAILQKITSGEKVKSVEDVSGGQGRVQRKTGRLQHPRGFADGAGGQ